MKSLMHAVIFGMLFTLFAGAADAQVVLRPTEAQITPAEEALARSHKDTGAFYVSCAFTANVADGAAAQTAIPLMFVVKTDFDRQALFDGERLTRSFGETFDAVEDPRGLFDKNGKVTIVDRRPAYLLIEWKDSSDRNATLLLPYAGASQGLHILPAVLGHGRLNPSLDPQDWKVIPGGTLENTLRAKCRAYETKRGSVVMGQAK